MKKKLESKIINQIIFQKNKFDFILAIILSVMTALFEIFLAFVLMALIDESSKGGINSVLEIVMYIGILTVVYVIVGILSTRMSASYIKKSVCNLKSELIRSIINKPLSDVSKKSTGAYISILNNDLTTVENNYIVSSISIIRNFVMIIVAVISMFYIQWILTLVVLITLILPLLISAAFSEKLKTHQNAITNSNQSLNSIIKDVLSGMPVIKGFNIEKQICNILNNKLDVAEDSKRKFANASGLQTTLMSLVSLLMLVAIFSLGTYLTLKGKMTIGGIIAFVQLLNNLTKPISSLFIDITKRKSCNSIFNLFNEILKKSENVQKDITIDGVNSYITIENTSYFVDGVTEIIHNISYKFECGKSYAIVGLSGSGKSTLLSLLAGYYNNYNGSIKIDDSEIREISEDSLYKSLSLVQQESFIFNDTIENNIKLFTNWTQEDVNSAIDNACLTPLIKERGAEFACGENGSNLSGGERQRISIARALLRKTSILLLDEATSALDVTTATTIEDNLSKLDKVTRIVITHKLDETILRKYDSIIMMQDGEIKEDGTYDELIKKKGHFYALTQVNS